MITRLADFLDNYVEGFFDGEQDIELGPTAHRYNGYVDGWYAGQDWFQSHGGPVPDEDYIRIKAREEWENQTY